MTQPGADHQLVVDIARTGSGLKVQLRGELDLASVPRVEELAGKVAGEELVVLDLEHLTFIDSTGLKALLALQAAVGAASGRLQLAKVPARVRKLLELTNLTTRFEIADPGAST